VKGSPRATLVLAALGGLMSVAAGAFGAHGVHDPQAAALLRTGAQYQSVHAVAALLCFGLVRLPPRLAAWAGGLFAIGGWLFGATLYLLALTGVRWLGAITPIGGLLLMAGWAALAWGAARANPPPLRSGGGRGEADGGGS
jgi:uncharacterized membrane protein YgdD (TMEM256/DUF423 family)